MPHIGTPPADIIVTPELVQTLINKSRADLKHLPILKVAEGWDNEIYRVGSNHAIRIPKRKSFSYSIVNEQEWLPKLNLSVDTPVPLYSGKPNTKFPYPWSIVPWLSGNPADLEAPHLNQAKFLAEIIKQIHSTNSTNAPFNGARSIPICDKFEQIRDQYAEIGCFTLPTHRQIIENALNAKPNTKSVLIHGDLHPQNILVSQGKISAVIDWGDICAGDPATDAAVFYALFPEPSMIFHYSNDTDLVSRAKGWALVFATMLIFNGRINSPRHLVMGQRILQNLALN